MYRKSDGLRRRDWDVSGAAHKRADCQHRAGRVVSPPPTLIRSAQTRIQMRQVLGFREQSRATRRHR